MKKWFGFSVVAAPLLVMSVACRNQLNSPASSVSGSAVRADSAGATEVFCGWNPCSLSCQSRGNEVVLTWSAADQGIFRNPDGYYIFRAASSGGPYQLAQTLPIPDGSVHLQPVQAVDDPGPGTWCYEVQAFRNNPTAVSEMTNECCSTVGGAPTPTPTPQGPPSL